MENLPLTIIHQEESFVVVDKPSGLLSIPGNGPDMRDCVANRIRDSFTGCIDQPAVHRLDMDTSGLMLLGISKEAHRELSIQFIKRQVEKYYVALLEGIVEEDSGTIELAFRRDEDNKPHQMYDPVNGKLGKTHWKKIALEGEYTRIDFNPLTGRTHQLRLHASHELGLGIPIVGDRLYGTGTEPGKLKLHARYLSFFHPETGEKLEFSTQAPF